MLTTTPGTNLRHEVFDIQEGRRWTYDVGRRRKGFGRPGGKLGWGRSSGKDAGREE
jgi:hypothetical protein